MALVNDGEGGGERPSVSDTLAQATRALHTHREWMKRRISSVTPLHLEALPDAKKVAWTEPDDRKLEASGVVTDSPSLGGEQSATSSEERAMIERKDAPAPPTLHSPRLSGGGTQRKKLSAKVAPLGEGGKASFGDVTGRQGPRSNAWEDKQSPTPRSNPGSRSDETASAHLKAVSAKKKRRAAKATVVPMVTETVQTGPLVDAQKTPLDAFFATSSPPTASPPALVTTAAWGSLSSLDQYIDSLDTKDEGRGGKGGGREGSFLGRGEEDRGEPRQGVSVGTTAVTDLEQDHAPVLPPGVPTEVPACGDTSANMHSERSVTGARHLRGPLPPLVSFNATSTDAVQSVSQVNTIPAPIPVSTKVTSYSDTSLHRVDSSGLPPDTTQLPNGKVSDHSELTSGATLVPVSPAPKQLRSSYHQHKDTRLASSEAGIPLVDTLARESTNGGQRSNEIRIMSRGASLGERSTANWSLDVPEATLTSVSPVLHTRERRTGADVVTFNTAFSILTSTSATPPSDMPSSATPPSATPPSDMPPSDTHPAHQYFDDCRDELIAIQAGRANLVPQGSQGTEMAMLKLPQQEEPISRPHSPIRPMSRNETEMFPASRTGQYEEREMSVAVEHDVVMSAPRSEVETGRAYPEVKKMTSSDGTVAVLDGGKMVKQLPSLKLPTPSTPSLIDGGEMVKQLPPLKLPTPSLTDLTLSSKRLRSPPPYSIHLPLNQMAPAPPCPIYGTKQPLEKEFLRNIRRKSVQVDTRVCSTDGGMGMHRQSSLISLTSLGGQTGLGSRQLSQLSLKLTSPSPFGGPESVDGYLVQPDQLNAPQTYGSGGLQFKAHPCNDKGQSPRLPNRTGVSSSPTSAPLISEMPPGPGALHFAARSGNLRRLQVLISQGHDVNMPDQEGRTPLMYCITPTGVHLSCADALMREGANLNRQAADGSTATHLAAFSGAVALVELTLLNGANPDIRDFDGRLPIHWATTPQSHKSLGVLLKHSSLDHNTADDSGMTPLMWAAYNNNATVTAYLLDHGADWEEKDMDGYTAMHWAVHRDSILCLEMLLKPDMTFFKDQRGRTVMHHAAEKGSMAACELILKMRPDAIHDTDKQNRAPLHYAAACSRVDVCALLLDRGSDAAQRDHSGMTPLDYARTKKLDYVVALLSCHSTAVADFARASRSTSISSLLSRSTSFPQLPIELSTVTPDLDIIAESLSMSDIGHSSDQQSVKDGGCSAAGVDIEGVEEEESEVEQEGEVGEGGGGGGWLEMRRVGYLGRFTHDKRDPIQHFFFWLERGSCSLCWSREQTQQNHKSATVEEVHEGPSSSVLHSPYYSPGDLHKFVFWVLTDSCSLDLFAYNEEAYTSWMRELKSVTLKRKRRNASANSSLSQSSSSFASATGGNRDGESQEAAESSALACGGWTDRSLVLVHEDRPEKTRGNDGGRVGSGSSSSGKPWAVKGLSLERKFKVQPLTSTPLHVASQARRDLGTDSWQETLNPMTCNTKRDDAII